MLHLVRLSVRQSVMSVMTYCVGRGQYLPFVNLGLRSWYSLPDSFKHDVLSLTIPSLQNRLDISLLRNTNIWPNSVIQRVRSY